MPGVSANSLYVDSKRPKLAANQAGGLLPNSTGSLGIYRWLPTNEHTKRGVNSIVNFIIVVSESDSVL